MFPATFCFVYGFRVIYLTVGNRIVSFASIKQSFNLVTHVNPFRNFLLVNVSNEETTSSAKLPKPPTIFHANVIHNSYLSNAGRTEK